MLSYIDLTNFLSFEHIKFDLRGAHGIPKQLAFIYGENGSGKSNLMQALYFISVSLNTLRTQEKIKDFDSKNIKDRIGDTEDMSTSRIEELLDIIYMSRFGMISDIYKRYKSFCNPESDMIVELGFYLEGKEGKYVLEFDNLGLAKEELKYQIKQRVGVMYSISREEVELSPSIFFNKEYRDELKISIEKFWGKHSFLSIIFNEKFTKNSGYIKRRINKNFFTVLEWFSNFSISCLDPEGKSTRVAIRYEFLHHLEEGKTDSKDNKELNVFERALNLFFTGLYSDIKKVYYKITPAKSDFKYELYIKKEINEKIIDIPFRLESTGTKKLLDIFPFLFTALAGNSVFVDEIDSGIHDLLMSNILETLEESLKGQFVATTHNTLLMKQLPPENVYIIKTDYNGHKDIVCIKEYPSYRTQKNNNMQIRYLEGVYSGIPFIGNLDFDEIMDEIVEELPPVNFGE